MLLWTHLTIKSEKDLKALNEKIAIYSLFSVGETITNNPLHIGENIFSDKRIFDSVKEYAFTHNFVDEAGEPAMDALAVKHKLNNIVSEIDKVLALSQLAQEA